ncbi:uncharacterized protein LOC114936753 isoform X2 [Nylanderia fulva]|uniref:uncharacterized protein LOC114936753 isoform X2 n=1 Tax=Nylanderia fulva TaxID=613905 RepID=UPI0010FB35A3|nr:uncharacterized protein LOC114936753 isoform X2 [Nylanderia fulva]
MDSADEQDVETTPGGMPNGANGPNGTNGAHEPNGTNGQHATPEGSLSYKEENDSDLDDDEVQDDEDFLSQPLQGSSQSLPMDIGAASTSSLDQINSLMNMHPQILTKLKSMCTEGEKVRTMNNYSLQNLMASHFSMPFMPSYGSPPPTPLSIPPIIPPRQQHQQQQQHPQNNHSQPLVSNTGLIVDPTIMLSRPPANSQTGESPQRVCRNSNSESSSQGSSRNNGESRESEPRGAATVNNQHPSGPNWNFEEQFRQVRQLYELDDNPERKEFLDELFTFMQQRGSPINRLPIMAKSVLDLYELYKLVVIRGGLVEVINKKLWQEIIKGLRLPASITSAAFTLRTQYMKYLYHYEQHKEKLSTNEQLNTAIETNRREGRRSNNYPGYSGNNENMVGRSQHNSLPPNTLPLPMPLNISPLEMHRSQSPFVNGHPQQQQQQHHPHNPHISNLSSFSDYMLQILRDNRNSGTNSIIQQQSDPSPLSAEALNALELSKLSLWNNICQNNNKIYVRSGQQPFSPPTSHSPIAPVNSPEPQREALDLANSTHRSDPVSPSARSVDSPPAIMPRGIKRSQESLSPSTPSNKKMLIKEEQNNERNSMRITQMVRIRDSRRELFISVDIDGVLYEGVLPAKNDDSNSPSSSSKRS